MSASQVARITGMSHWLLAHYHDIFSLLKCLLLMCTGTRRIFHILLGLLICFAISTPFHIVLPIVSKFAYTLLLHRTTVRPIFPMILFVASSFLHLINIAYREICQFQFKDCFLWEANLNSA
jgi:hypothetical protein